jgi:hypothetical protein
MRKELAGEIPDNPVRIEGFAYPERKRNATSPDHDRPVAQRLKMAEPQTFSGKNIKDLNTFDIEWKIRHEAEGEIDAEEWPQRIRRTATYLKRARCGCLG